MPWSAPMLALAVQLTNASSRPTAAQALAELLGGEDLLIFIRDPEISQLLPAPGFPQTLPGGRRWQAFLRECLRATTHCAELPFPTAATTRRITGQLAADGSVLVIVGGNPLPGELAELCLLVPLLAAAFQNERAVQIAQGQAAVVHAAEAQSRLLTTSLDTARRELQDTLGAMRSARQRTALLVEASDLLAQSLEYTANLANVAQLFARSLADCCIIEIQAQEELPLVIVAHVHPHKETEIRQRLESAALRASDQAHPPQGETLQPADQPADRRPGTLTTLPDQSQILAAIDARASITVPLTTRGRIIGSITCAYERPGRVYSTEDADLIKELARRIAIAVDNAWLYAEAQAGIRLRDQFLSIASHEIKTPLTALLGNAHLFARRVKREGQLTERNQQTLQIVIRQAERLNRLITMLFDLSRIQLDLLQLQLVPLDLRALVQRIVEEVQIQLDSHRFEIKGADQPLIVLADELRLEQVFQNLFGNAVKYSPEGGLIEVLLEQREARAYMHVTDQGIGIPAAAIPHLFRRFYRAGNADTHRISGLGIGLYVTREILAQHHGTIEITSVEGQGSTFSIALPLCSEQALAERAK